VTKENLREYLLFSTLVLTSPLSSSEKVKNLSSLALSIFDAGSNSGLSREERKIFYRRNLRHVDLLINQENENSTIRPRSPQRKTIVRRHWSRLQTTSNWFWSWIQQRHESSLFHGASGEYNSAHQRWSSPYWQVSFSKRTRKHHLRLF